MFIPIDQILTPSRRNHLTIQETSLPHLAPPLESTPRRRRRGEARQDPPDTLLQAERSYQQVRHMAYLAVIQEAYRNFTVEG